MVGDFRSDFHSGSDFMVAKLRPGIRDSRISENERKITQTLNPE